MIRKIAVITAGLILIMGCLCMSGCGTDDIDISKYADKQITLTGITDEDIVITIADLKALDCKTIKASSTSDKIGELKVTGPELDTVLESYGVSKKDFHKIIFHGTDQYDVPLLNDYIVEHPIYLAFGQNGEPLDNESAPCRVIIPDSNSAYWIRMVDGIEFEK